MFDDITPFLGALGSVGAAGLFASMLFKFIATLVERDAKYNDEKSQQIAQLNVRINDLFSETNRLYTAESNCIARQAQLEIEVSSLRAQVLALTTIQRA